MNIRWAAGAQTSLADGIRVVGCPAYGVAAGRLVGSSNCSVRNALRLSWEPGMAELGGG